MAVLMLSTFFHSAMAQLKPLTLEELNYGGKNYRQMSPANETYVWWGDQLVKTDHKTCESVNTKNLERTPLFTLDEVNATLAEGKRLYSLIGTTFPYADSTIAVIDGPKERLLYDWKKKAVTWRQSSCHIHLCRPAYAAGGLSPCHILRVRKLRSLITLYRNVLSRKRK